MLRTNTAHIIAATILTCALVSITGCGSDSPASNSSDDGGNPSDAGDMPDAGGMPDAEMSDASNTIDYGDPGTPGQPWVDVTPTGRSPSPRDYPHMAYDAARQQVLLFTGGETWIWTGAIWEMAAAAPSPNLQSTAPIAYDAARQEVVRFGGWRVNDDTVAYATWVWDGSSWTERTSAMTPPSLFGHAMAYDAAREQIVLHGGGGNPGFPPNEDTWVWDGSSWSIVESAAGTGPKAALAMVYDPGSQSVLANDGKGLWSFDGNAWTQVDQPEQATTPPYNRSEPSMIYDPQRERVLLFGGYNGATVFQDTWAWDGTSWSDITAELGEVPTKPFNQASPAYGQAAALDQVRGELVLYGGLGDTTTETVALRDESWTYVSPDASPPARTGAAMAYDAERKVVLLYGGQAAAGGRFFDDYTWSWDGEFWRRIPDALPGERFGAAMAFDAKRKETILFGGAVRGDKDETFRWDGSTWTLVPTNAAPSVGQLSSMVWDAGREQILLFDQQIRETWAWDGENWTRLQEKWPDGFRGNVMVYDPMRQAPLLLGEGRNLDGDTILATLAWNGTTWEAIETTSKLPPTRLYSAAFWDPRRASIVMFGGNYMKLFGDTWELAGDTWRELTPSVGPSARQQHSVTFDHARGRGVLFGGGQTGAATWEWIGPAARPLD